MTEPVFNDNQIREYLLGRVIGPPRLVKQFDVKVLTDPEFSEYVDMVADEIIEEYLEGTLTPADVQAVETYFLCPPERQSKARKTRLLNYQLSRSLAAGSEGGGEPKQRELPRTPDIPDAEQSVTPPSARVLKFPSVRAYLEIAAALLCVASLAYLAHQRHEMTLALEQNHQQLDEGHSRIAALNQQLDSPLRVITSSSEGLRLFEPGLTRGEPPTVKIGAASRTLHVQVAIPPLSGNAPPPQDDKYRVLLKQGERTLWSQDDVSAQAVPGGLILNLSLAADLLPNGICRLVLSQPGRQDLYYSFAVSDHP